MSSTTPAAPPDPPADATPEEIEAHIEASRERLASSVDALTAKLDVKAQAKQKAQETSAQAKQKARETSERVQAGAQHAYEHLRAGTQHVASRVRRSSRRCCCADCAVRRPKPAILPPKLIAGRPLSPPARGCWAPARAGNLSSSAAGSGPSVRRRWH